ncbi:hypothetical protein H4582DRAFT_1020220 [Lactarius indigo]|nr:hypothetical protein H4582DRAFT_1020220 [Lactarius indigo]
MCPEKHTPLVRSQFSRATFAHQSRRTLTMFSGASNPDPTAGRLSVFFGDFIGSFAGLDSDQWPVVVTFCLTLPHVRRSSMLLVDGLPTTRLDGEPFAGATRTHHDLAGGLGGDNRTMDDSSSTFHSPFRTTSPHIRSRWTCQGVKRFRSTRVFAKRERPPEAHRTSDYCTPLHPRRLHTATSAIWAAGRCADISPSNLTSNIRCSEGPTGLTGDCGVARGSSFPPLAGLGLAGIVCARGLAFGALFGRSIDVYFFFFDPAMIYGWPMSSAS